MAMHARRPGESAPVNALRLSPGQLRDLHEGLDRYRSAEFDRENRFNERFAYRASQPVCVRIEHPGGSSVDYLVEPRDLSCTGLGFLHGAFIHPGSVCHVTLTDCEGKTMLVRGTVRRCQYLEGRLHVIGVEFKDKVNVSMFDVQAYSNEEADDSDSEQVLRLTSTLAGEPRVQAALAEYVDRMAVLTKDVVQALRIERIALAQERCRSLQKAAQRFGYPPIERQAELLAKGFEGNRLAAGWQENLLELGSLVEAAKRGLAA